MPRLFGFEDMAYRRVREREAAGTRQMASRRLQPQSYPHITAWANDAGYRTTRGGLWRPASLANMLDNPAIAGLTVVDETGKLEDSGGPRIIEVDEFKAIRAMRADRTSDADPREYPLSGGLAVCGLCTTALGASPSGSGARGYRCAPSTAQHPGGCGKVRIVADPFETYVAEHVLAEMAKPAVSKLIGQAREQMLVEAAALRAQVEADRKRHKELGESYAGSTQLSLAAFRAADEEFIRLIRENTTKARLLEQVRHVPVGRVPDLTLWWKHAPLTSKKGALILMLNQVVVYSAAARGSRTVDSSRVMLDWRTWGEPSAKAAS